MYVMQMHVREYQVFVRSGDLVTVNTLFDDEVYTTITEDGFMAQQTIRCLNLEDEGPETIQTQDWSL